MILISSSMFLGTPKSINKIGLFFLIFKAFSIAPFPIRGPSVIDEEITIQGNLNPDFFKKNEEEIELKAHEIFTKFKDRKNYIFNVGEGLTPDLDPEKIKIFLKTLRSLNSQ